MAHRTMRHHWASLGGPRWPDYARARSTRRQLICLLEGSLASSLDINYNWQTASYSSGPLCSFWALFCVCVCVCFVLCANEE